MEVITIIGVLAFLFWLNWLRSSFETHKETESKLRRALTDLGKAQKRVSVLDSQKNDLNNCYSNLYKANSQNKELASKIYELNLQCSNLEDAIKQKDELYESLNIKPSESFEYIASLISDHLVLQYKLSAKHLKTKKHPALVEAKRIKELKEETKTIIYKSKLLEYKYEYIFQLFPDLELYVDDIDSINELGRVDNLEELKLAVDRTRNYLSKDEYETLSENKRNQLALDRYIESQKSKWQIGRDYELYIGYEYSNDGWDVEYFGIDKQLQDMGRDLIATKDDLIHVIQCKYWAKNKLIHEKHIAQLYGTTVQYQLSSKTKKEVVPVFVTNISLSDTAKSFAEYLGVTIIKNKDFEEFPRIKCNVNRDEDGYETKIYHPPMDQQYDRTKISKNGEFFAFTVEEAHRAGFRRAWKWYGNQ
ncbi:MAG: restriction endonuclease [Candidatus Thiodiazotropha endolucinida]